MRDIPDVALAYAYPIGVDRREGREHSLHRGNDAGYALVHEDGRNEVKCCYLAAAAASSVQSDSM